MEVKFKDVSMVYDGSDKRVLDHINFTIEDGELVSILGPSGGGKSTTLMLIAGLIFPTDGQIYFDNEDVTSLDAVKRKVGMVFQNYALYPYLNVRDNIAFPLKMAKKSKEERVEVAERLAKLVRVEEHLDKKPGQLSGGQQQRVAIARALAKSPSLLLMDEPLSNLDAKLRIEMREEIRRIQQETGITTIFVTHDQNEALNISDHVLVLEKGVIQQTSAPQELYENPSNRFVAEFLGTPEINTFSYDDSQILLMNAGISDAERQLVDSVAIRPEHLHRATMNEAVLFEGEVVHLSHIAREREVRVEMPGGQIVRMVDLPVIDFTVGDKIQVAADAGSILWFDQNGERVIPS